MDSGYLLATALEDSQTGGIVVASGVMPTSLDPWCKSLLWPGGLEFTDPERELTTTLQATQLNDRLLYVPLDGDEYLLVENRQTDLNGDQLLYLDRDATKRVILGPGLSTADTLDTTGDKEYDFLLPGQGIFVWHIDPSVFCTVTGEVAGSGDTFECGPNANPDHGINSNPDRLGVGLVEADGIRDIGDPSSYYFYGSPFDAYFVGNHTVLGPDTNPSTRTNDGAVSHVTLRVLSPPGVEMGISIASAIRVPGWPLLSATGRGLGAPTSGSLLHDGRRSLVTGADSLILAWMAWKTEVAGKALENRDGLTPEQRFFVGYAQWACGNERPESLRVKALTDPHSPGKYRVNGLMVNMPEFERAFACKPGQPMVAEKRCRVW